MLYVLIWYENWAKSCWWYFRFKSVKMVSQGIWKMPKSKLRKLNHICCLLLGKPNGIIIHMLLVTMPKEQFQIPNAKKTAKKWITDHTSKLHINRLAKISQSCTQSNKNSRTIRIYFHSLKKLVVTREDFLNIFFLRCLWNTVELFRKQPHGKYIGFPFSFCR